jgi:hypothetical protein
MNRNSSGQWLLLLVVPFICITAACTSTIDSPTIDSPTHMATVDHAGKLISSGPISDLSLTSAQPNGPSLDSLTTPDSGGGDGASCSCGWDADVGCSLGGCSSRDLGLCAACWMQCCAASH